MRARTRWIAVTTAAAVGLSLVVAGPAKAADGYPTVVSSSVSATSVDVTSGNATITVTVAIDDESGSADPVAELYNESTDTEDAVDAVEMDYVATVGAIDSYTATLTVPDTLTLGSWDVLFWPYLDDWENVTGDYDVVGHLAVGKHWTGVGSPSLFLQGKTTSFRYLEAGRAGIDQQPDSIAYSWYRSGSASPISGAGGARYLMTTADVGHRLRVVATLTKAGYPPLVISSPESAVITAYPLPKVTMWPKVAVGERVYEDDSPIVTTTPRQLQWNLDGVAIPGATKGTYTPTRAQGGHRLSVTLSWSGTAGQTITATSARVLIRGAFATPKVRLTGSPKVGHRLTAHVSGWGATKVKQRYLWMSNGATIRGQHASSFVPTKRYRGTVVTVDVQGKKTGYQTRWSPPSRGVHIR